MLIERIGFTVVKGGRHVTRTSVDLTTDGPVGDRAFCLVDRARRRVLRTVDHPSLMRASVTWSAGVLAVHLPGVAVEGVPVPAGEELKVDYWGRVARLEVVDGPWAAAYSDLLGVEVLLARVVHPGEVVYGAPVSLVTTSSLRLLAERLGADVAGERFRATFLLDTGSAEPHVEDAWIGRQLTIGEARVEVRSVIPRCAVVDRNPSTGQRDAHVLDTLGGYRLEQGSIGFGVDAVVTTAGRVRTGDPVVDPAGWGRD